MFIRSRRFLIAAFLVLSLFPVTDATGQVIFVDPCGITIPQFTYGLVTVWVCVEGPIQGGITGAEFRLAGVPATWVAEVLPTAPVTLMNDLTAGGATFDTHGCATGQPVPGGGYLELCKVNVFATSAETDILFMPAATNPPQPAPFDCPFVTLCDEPVFTKVCCIPHGAWVNPVVQGCALAVEAESWSHIKDLYR